MASKSTRHQNIYQAIKEETMERELHRNTSVPHTTWECEPSLINSRPSVIHNTELERVFPTRGQDGLSYRIQSATSAFTPFYRKGSCPLRLTGQSRLSSFDSQVNLQQRPVVLSGGRPSHLTSSYDPVDPHEPAQKIQEMNQFSALFPGWQRKGNPRCSSIRGVGSASVCGQENHGQSDEDYQMDFGRGKHKKVPYLICPDQKIQESVLPGQRLGVHLYSQPPEGATSEPCNELQVSPSSDARESYDLRSQEIQEENDVQEGQEQEEQLKEFSYKVAPNNANYCNPLSRDKISGSFDEEYGIEGVHACVPTINHDETQNEINGTSKRKEDERQPSREHVPTRCQNLCCRDPAPQMCRHGNMPKNTDNVNSEMEKRANYMSTYWTQSHQGGTTCLVCFKTLKRSYYMKSHMLIHTGDKPYKCAHCTKAFNQVGNRNAHQRIHTGEKPYTCEYCGKQFIFNSSKHNHMKVHCRTSFHFQ